MTLPRFLIIGAMKAGTTTLFEDLSTSPDVFFPSDKEPGDLASELVLRDAGRDAYETKYRRASSSQITGDASTIYSKRPDIEGCARRAREVLGPNTKIVYVVREPVARALSQYNHEFGMREVSVGVNEALQQIPRFIDYSRYAYQLSEWLNYFGKKQVLVVKFEDYMMSRIEESRRVADFLGIDPDKLSVDPTRRFNVSSDKVVAVGLLGRLVRSRIYRVTLRRLLTRGVRASIARRILPPNPIPDSEPTQATIDLIIREVETDCEQLRVIMGRDEPLWDLQGARNAFMREQQ